jgi:purine-cytosine permease-like protein
LLPQLIAVLLYVGFNVFNTIIAAAALHAVVSIAVPVTILIAAAGGLVLAYGGYDWIHWIQRWGTYLFVVLGGIFTVGALFTVHLPAVAGGGFGLFKLTPFLVVFVTAAAYQISSAPYVSDYSRYLGRTVTPRQCFLWTYAGAMVGAFWMIALGGVLLAAHPTASTVSVVGIAGNRFITDFGSIILVLGFLMLLGTVALNMYSGSQALLAMVDTVKRVKPRLSFRASTVLLITVVATAGALTLPANFLTAYSNFLTILLYFLIPWTAVNLVDFYLVRRGRYAVKEIFKRDGIYGRWQWRGLAAYALGFCVMIPFMSTAVFTGPVANALHGADLSVFVGLPVAGGFYYLISRHIDLTNEYTVADADARELEGVDARPETALGSGHAS